MLTKTNNLYRSTPETQGIRSSAILEFVRALDTEVNEAHSFMLVRHGHVVAEGWWSPYAPEHPHMLFSLSKSFTSTAVGMAISEGLFTLDDPVISFFPDDLPEEINDNLKAMTVHHLLSMSTGNDEDTTPHMVQRKDGNWTKGFFSVPVVHEPGTHFLYNTGATYILSAIVQKTSGKKLTEFLTPRLFEPLGIENPIWEVSPQGIETGGFGLNVKTEDIARFGQLYLQKGNWQGKQLIPESWIEKATSFQVSNGDDPKSDWNQGYGYQFWMCQHDNYRGDGAFGQYCIVMPKYDAVLAMTSGLADMQKPLNLVWDILLPAMEAEPLPEDTVFHESLKSELSALAFPAVDGKASVAMASQVTGKTYQLEDNPMKLETLSFQFAESACSVQLKTAHGEENFACGYNAWQQGETMLMNDEWETEPAPIVTSGAWTSDNCFTMLVRFYLTPFFYKMDMVFDDDDLTINAQINVSFESTETQVIKAHVAN